MKARRQLSAAPKNLRARAEKLLATSRHDVAQMPVEDVQKLVHELQVHQIELEMQNDELRRVQQELEITGDRYANLYDFAPVALLTLNAPGEILEANFNAGELFGRSREDLLRKKFTRFVPPEAQDAFYLFSRLVFSRNGRHSAELNLINAQAKRLVVQVEAVREVTGKQGRFSFTDITERRRAEVALREASQFSQQIIAGAEEGIIVNGLDLKHLVWNPFMEALTGLPAAQVIGKHPLELFPFLEEAGVIQQMKRALKGETDAPLELQFLVPQSGRGGWASNLSSPLRNTAGTIIGVITIVRDITERKRAEDALRQSDERYRNLFNTLIEGFCVIEVVFDARNKPVDYRFLEVNPVFEKQTGLHQAQGRLMRELAPEHEAHWFEIYGQIALTGEPARFVNEARALGRWYEVSAYRLGGPESRKVAILFNDITDRKQAEARIAQLDRAEAMLAGVDHAIVHLNDRQKLLDEVCRVAVEKGGFKLAWIGLVAPDGAVQPVAKAGLTDYLKDIQVVTQDVPAGRGAVGTAIRENRPVVVENIEQDARMAPWEKRLRQFKLRFLAAFPLRIAGRVAGAFSVYAPRANFFDETELNLLTQVSDDIAFALTTLDGVAARELAEAALRRSEHNLVNFFNEAPIGLLWLTAGGTILRANLAQLELLGYAAEEYVGHSFLEFCGDPAQGRELLERLAAKETVSNLAMSRRCKDGTVRHVLVSANSFWSDAWGDNQFLYSSIFMRDVTERVKLEREILQAGEREQQRIARDLHDGLGQLLGGTAYLTSALQKNLSAKARAESRQAGRILEVIHEAIEQTRNLARGLHPVEPEPQGLMSALDALAGRTKKLFNVRCQFSCRQPVLVADNSVATHLFRIAQEAITNAIKHGRAGRIEIGLTATPGRIGLRVHDDGTGIPARPRKKTGMGLRIMRYRAGMIGGSLAIQKEARGGTTVVCTVQLAGVADRLAAAWPAKKLSKD